MTDCFIAQLLANRADKVPASLIRCDGKLDRHHPLPQQRIRREWNAVARFMAENRDRAEAQYGVSFAALMTPAERLRTVLDDPRGWVRVCRKHHEHVENRRIIIWRSDLPEEFFEFAADLGLEGWAHRYFPAGAAA